MKTLTQAQPGEEATIAQVLGSENQIAALGRKGLAAGAPISVEKVSKVRQTVDVVAGGHHLTLPFKLTDLIELYDAAAPAAPEDYAAPAPADPTAPDYGAYAAAPAQAPDYGAYAAAPAPAAAYAPAPAPAPYAPPPAPAPAPEPVKPIAPIVFSKPAAPAPAPTPAPDPTPATAPAAAPSPAAPSSPVDYEYRVVPVPVFEINGWQPTPGADPVFTRAGEAAAANLAAQQLADLIASNAIGGWELLLKTKLEFAGAAAGGAAPQRGTAHALVFRRPKK